MKIWILNHYAETADGQATRSFDLAKELVRRGHEVTIFAAGFSHYKFREEHLRAGETWREEDVDGVCFVWLKTLPYRKNDLRRMLNMLSYASRALWVCCRRREAPDAIIGVSVHPFAALAGWAASVARGSRFFVELTDLWPEVLIDFGVLSRRNPITWVLRAMETFLYRKAERILMIWPRTEEYVQGLGISPAKIVWIPHLADLSRYEKLKRYDGVIRDRFTVMYLGSFVSFMAMEVILDAAKVLQDRGRREIRFVLVGGGTDAERLQRYAAELRVTNVEFPGLVPKKEIARVMSEADAFVVSLRDVPLLKYGVSLNKTCDYLASSRPAVMAGNPGYDPIKEANAGFSVPAENPEALAGAIESLMNLTPNERVSLGLNGIEYLRRVHGVDVLGERLERTLLGKAAKDSANEKIPVAAIDADATSVYETRA